MQNLLTLDPSIKLLAIQAILEDRPVMVNATVHGQIADWENEGCVFVGNWFIADPLPAMLNLTVPPIADVSIDGGN